MKKTVLWMLLLTLLISLAFSGCSDDDKKSNNTITGGSLADIEGNFDFALGIIPFDIFDKGMYFITIQSYDYEQSVTTAELKINDSAITLDQEGWDGYYFFYGEVILNQGQDISYEVTINGSSYSGELTVPYRPQNVTFPAEYDPTQSYDISWSLTADSQFQLFEAYGWDGENDDNDDGKFKELSSSARSFTIPENWISANLDEYDLSVSEISAEWSGNFVAFVSDGSVAYYGYEDWKVEDKAKYMNKQVKKIVHLLQ